MKNQELLECLAPYLPYNLRAQVKIKGKQTIITVMYYHIWEYIKKPIDAKPILRPLSDLTKFCLESGKVPIEEIVNLLFDDVNVIKTSNKRFECLFDTKYGRNRLVFNTLHLGFTLYPYDDFDQFEALKFMYKHHFDIHGLIEKGYAVDVNSVTKCTSK